jgi:hypothetical protein
MQGEKESKDFVQKEDDFLRIEPRFVYNFDTFSEVGWLFIWCIS